MQNKSMRFASLVKGLNKTNMLVGAGVLLVLSAFAHLGLHQTLRCLDAIEMAKKSEHWTPVEAIVKAADLKISSGEYGPTYTVEVKYDYTVNDRRYEGSRIAFGYDSSDDEEAHSALLATLNKAKTLRAYCNPEDPWQAVLVPGIKTGLKLKLMIDLIFLGFPLMCICIGLVAFLASRSKHSVADSILVLDQNYSPNQVHSE